MGKTRTEATRAERKAKKRAAEDAIPDVPETWAVDAEPESSSKAEKKDSKKRKRGGEDEPAVVEEKGEEGEKESKKERKRRRKEAEESTADGAGEGVKKEKRSKKEKITAEEPAPATEAEEKADTEMLDAAEAPKKSKKERKAERKAKDALEAAAIANGTSNKTPAGEAVSEANGDAKAEGVKKSETAEGKSKKNNRNREKKRKGETGTAADAEAAKPKNARFIVFVGNLPFTANSTSIAAHFASVKPKSIRAPTEKGNDTKSKGFAFVEFEGYDHMKTALKLFHHSTFDDGKSAQRKINVDLTAGGGGKGTNRTTKITDKNTKLNEQRVRRMQEEEKAKNVKKAGGAGADKAAVGESGIHPSRRAIVPSA